MPSIVFAFYKNDRLIGYRLDTIGTIGLEYPKIYTYSKEQVEIVLKNINHNVLSASGIGETLMSKTNNPIAKLIMNREKEVNELLNDEKVFEVRVLKCPDKIYETYFEVESATWKKDIWGEYPAEEIKTWLQYPEEHEVIETHYFSTLGLINQN